MLLPGARGQQTRDFLYNASGTITTGGTPQLVLPEGKSRSLLVLENLSSGNLWFEFGSAQATCTISGGAVNAVSIVNGGFNFTQAPFVTFLGGFYAQATSGNVTTGVGVGFPGFPSPMAGQGTSSNLFRIAQGAAVLAAASVGSKVASVTINDGGAGYQTAPYVFFQNSLLDPLGVADPSLNSGVGILLLANGGSQTWESTACPTDAVAVYGATTGQRFTAKFML